MAQPASADRSSSNARKEDTGGREEPRTKAGDAAHQEINLFLGSL